MPDTTSLTYLAALEIAKSFPKLFGDDEAFSRFEILIDNFKHFPNYEKVWRESFFDEDDAKFLSMMIVGDPLRALYGKFYSALSLACLDKANECVQDKKFDVNLSLEFSPSHLEGSFRKIYPHALPFYLHPETPPYIIEWLHQQQLISHERLVCLACEYHTDYQVRDGSWLNTFLKKNLSPDILQQCEKMPAYPISLEQGYKNVDFQLLMDRLTPPDGGLWQCPNIFGGYFLRFFLKVINGSDQETPPSERKGHEQLKFLPVIFNWLQQRGCTNVKNKKLIQLILEATGAEWSTPEFLKTLRSIMPKAHNLAISEPTAAAAASVEKGEVHQPQTLNSKHPQRYVSPYQDLVNARTFSGESCEAISSRNIATLKLELSDLKDYEQKFIDEFAHFSFRLRHSSESPDAIIQSKKILSYHTLTQKQIKPRLGGTSESDVRTGNSDFVFFSMGITENFKRWDWLKRPAAEFIFPINKLLSHGWITLNDWADYGRDSIKYTQCEDVIRGAEIYTDKTKNYLYRKIVPGSDESTFTVARRKEVFHSKDILLGLALTIIRELREIKAAGGSYPDKFYALPFAEKEKATARLLDNFFKIEAKLPRKVRLSDALGFFDRKRTFHPMPVPLVKSRQHEMHEEEAGSAPPPTPKHGAEEPLQSKAKRPHLQ